MPECFAHGACDFLSEITRGSDRLVGVVQGGYSSVRHARLENAEERPARHRAVHMRVRPSCDTPKGSESRQDDRWGRNQATAWPWCAVRRARMSVGTNIRVASCNVASSTGAG